MPHIVSSWPMVAQCARRCPARAKPPPLAAAARRRWPVAGGKRGPPRTNGRARPRPWSPAGPPAAGEHPRRPFPGRARGAWRGEVQEARRGHRPRGPRRRSGPESWSSVVGGALELGHGGGRVGARGDPSSPPQAFEPPVARPRRSLSSPRCWASSCRCAITLRHAPSHHRDHEPPIRCDNSRYVRQRPGR